jgi:hypothetical protein
MARLELHVAQPVQRLLQTAQRLQRTALEREHVPVGIRGDGDGRGGPAQRSEHALHGRRGVLVVVDQDVLVRLFRVQVALEEGHGLQEESAEVRPIPFRERLEVPPVEPGHLAQLASVRLGDEFVERIGIEEALLGPQHEVGELLGERTGPEEGVEPRPVGRLLPLEQTSDEGVLLGGGQELRRRRVAQLLEPPAQHPEPEPVGGEHRDLREGPGQAVEQPFTGVPGPSTVEDEQGHALGARTSLDQPGEPLPEQDRLAGAGRAGDQQAAAVVLEHGRLGRIGLEGGRGQHGSMLAPTTDTPEVGSSSGWLPGSSTRSSLPTQTVGGQEIVGTARCA